MRDSITQSYDEIYNDEAEAQLSIFGNEENLEGVKAFFDKREPNFK